MAILAQAQSEYALTRRLVRYVIAVQRGLEQQDVCWPVLLYHTPVVVKL
jgi:hypothetical protein